MGQLFLALAALVLFVHLLFNAWVVAGALVTSGRQTLERLHILSLFYGAVMENVSWPCPLTLVQKCFLLKAGKTPYQGDFLVHYLQAVVSPNFPLELLRWGAIGVLVMNLGIYAHRYMRLRSHAFHH
ncbi:MAG TPA: DUF2784 family protein [Candidatus Dormibacteraeota bacterium]|nr:DUF2784 family protein [Candidatus Dormibacteraeota bacterium]